MPTAPRLIASLALAALLAGAAPLGARAPDTASLHFQGDAAPLAGLSYGLQAVDARPLVLGQRTHADIGAGHHTIWYRCPGDATMTGGDRVGFHFEAGKHYTLVCRAGRDAEIREADAC